MALDKHYGDFGGLDVSPNLLKQRPDTCRDGSTNFRWNYNDQLQKREGFQPKTAAGSECDAGLFEYKYKDIDTGEFKSQILGVSFFDGKLRKKNENKLKIQVTSASLVNYYSFIYDEVALTHKIIFYNAAKVSIGSVDISLSMQIGSSSSGLVKAINDLLISGLSAYVVDQTNAFISSSDKLAYLMNITFEYQFNKAIADSAYNEVYYWEDIPTPNGDVPFSAAAQYRNDDSYEGISYVNANNSIYITDGNFPFKYDGKMLYRAGMPKILQQKSITSNYSGLSLSSTDISPEAGYTAGEHSFLFQARHKDINGFVTIGKIQPITDQIYFNESYTQQSITLAGSTYTVNVFVPTIKQTGLFPTYSCKANIGSSLTLVAGANTLTVDSDHNIVVGMALKYSRYLLVTAATATTITFTVPASMVGFVIVNDQVLCGAFCPTNIINELVKSNTSSNAVQDPYGSYYVMFVSKAGVLDTYYQTSDFFSIPAKTAHEYTQSTNNPDSLLLTTISENESGEELPRACKYLSLWQNQIVQAGRPLFPAIAYQYYPTLYSTADVVDINTKNIFYYSEAHLCDYQSVYWADALFPEGFPQSGSNEEDFVYVHKDQITGIYANKEALFVFKNRTTGYLSGSPATGDIVKEFLEAGVGCATNQSIQDVSGAIVFMDENLGFWSVVAGRLPEFIGNPLIDYFKNNSIAQNDSKLKFKLARSTNFREQDQYICWIQAGYRDEFTPVSQYSLLFVFDYSSIGKSKRNCWYKWSGVNAGGGLLATSDGKLLISSYGNGTNQILVQKFTGSKYDFSDHTSAIEFNYKGAFLTLNEPTIDKSWIRCVINSIQGGFNLVVHQYANFIDTITSDYTMAMPSQPKQTVKMDVKASIPKLSGISWGFYNNEVNADVKIDGWEVEYNTPFDKGEPKK
jgi:hypothetical protein